MKKRLGLAECDIDFALKYKDDYPELAKNQYNLSVELMNGFKLQHEHIMQLIFNYKKTGAEVPADMQAVYDFVHEEFMEWAAEIKAKQDLFK